MAAEFSSGGRLEVRITPADVGKRVSVRRLIEINDGHPTFTDTVGVLTSWDEGVVCVTRRTGETVRIAESALVAGKVVPPAPARRGARGAPGDGEELEEIASRAWPADESAALGRLDAAGGRRLHPAGQLGAGRPATRACRWTRRWRTCGGWYGERGLTAWFQVPDTSPYGERARRARLGTRRRTP